MELKPGYKQTDVGVIPEGWDASKVQNASTNITVGFVGSMAHLFVREGVPLLRGQNILPQALDLTNLKFISKETHQLWKKSALLPDDIAIVRVGYPGTACTIPEGLGDINAASLVLVRPNKARLDSNYLTQVLNSSWGKGQVSSLLVGGAQQVFNTRTAADFVVPLPPVPEQRAIAGVLGDEDDLIASLGKLIAKKRDLKQAAMQQLLTGQTRLTGFNGEWEVKQLGEVFSITTGKSKSASLVSGGRYWVVDMGSVSTDGRLIVSKATNYSGDFLKVGDLVMPKDDIGGGNIIGRVGYIDANDTYVLGDHVYCLRTKEGDPLFLSYLINGYQMNTALRKKVIGSAQLGLGRKSVEEQEILFPLLNEQTAIATVLSDIDADLAALEQRLAKTRALKQGMMQELLTGRIRLV